jgi:hypothetical protein
MPPEMTDLAAIYCAEYIDLALSLQALGVTSDDLLEDVQEAPAEAESLTKGPIEGERNLEL